MYSLATAITTDLAIGLMDIGFVFGWFGKLKIAE
jgi:hypothetical protein